MIVGKSGVKIHCFGEKFIKNTENTFDRPRKIYFKIYEKCRLRRTERRF